MRGWINVFWFTLAIALVPFNGYGQTPFEFPEIDSQFIAQIGDDHYMVVEDMLYGGVGLWAVWKLNKSNGNWEIFAAGEPAPGEKSASGFYLYNSSRDILIWKINFSLFLGCAGPDVGISVFSAALSEPTLNLIEMDLEDENDVMELSLNRVSGLPGEIPGQWSLEFGPNSYLFNFNADGTMSVSGNVQECDID